MEKELFVRAEEVARELGISKPYAYKLVREMNEELKKKGFLTMVFGPEQVEAAVQADKQREQAEKGRKRPRRSVDRGER